MNWNEVIKELRRRADSWDEHFDKLCWTDRNHSIAPQTIAILRDIASALEAGQTGGAL